jgi:hypothetical protein
MLKIWGRPLKIKRKAPHQHLEILKIKISLKIKSHAVLKQPKILANFIIVSELLWAITSNTGEIEHIFILLFCY